MFVRREPELKRLELACADTRQNIILFHAAGGTGKTALLKAWLKQLEVNNWNGFDKVYGWSFYSQGTDEARQASSESFVHDALIFFGDAEPDAGTALDKAARLVALVQAQKTLLLLDGLEPLQHKAQPQGKLRDAGLERLLNDLALHNPGLLVVSSRLAIPGFDWQGVAQIPVDAFAAADGAALLQALGVQGTAQELETASTAFGGHGLALVLLATWLKALHGADVRCHQEVALLDAADVEYFGGHAQRVMRSYEQFFGEDSAEIALLKVLSLFDRPVCWEEVMVVLEPSLIQGLTDKLGHVEKQGGFLGFFQHETFVRLDDKHWAVLLQRLGEARLLNNSADADLGDEVVIAQSEDWTPLKVFDTHPLIREHFAAGLQRMPDVWREANRRLYEYYKNQAVEFPDSFETMQPLYAAVGHGCRAGLHLEALNDVYWKRILRENKFFSIRKLGLLGSDLSALAGMFATLWTRPVATLGEDWQGFILNHAAICLRAQSRLREALEPMRAGEDMRVAQESWLNAAKSAGNLSELQVTLGDLSAAVESARRSMAWADKSEDASWRMVSRTTLADALQLSGESEAALVLFAEAETMQQEWQSEYPLLYSLRGYRYCDALLARVAQMDNSAARGLILELRERGEKTLDWVTNHFTNMGLLDISLHHLTLARVQVLSTRFTVDNAGANPPYTDDNSAQAVEIGGHFQQAVAGLRDSGNQDDLPRGLLHRATWYMQQGRLAKAQRDLQEALQIAQRGEMRLHEVDAHLGFAALLKRPDFENLEALEPNLSAGAHLDRAEALIDATGYESRRGRLAALRQ
ncbi:hypothetical protein QUF61_12790 [Candidatus Venteria ishoeyi]|uniref:hypothetical protein n=1 Tax=Candidatus Venteria ishoeyi TaxID=1899563 RepID=UPI0025A60F8D|nr:hypothetical protein [Candidatus Venteria ishoeyi]MDM8547366.1 hypothetical protein [Candidatus Venteria ishoeyi]